MPHCDADVIHRPGLCRYCDDRPDLQARRILDGVNFTGEHDPAKTVCPSEGRRSVEQIERWPGNRPAPS